jgi:ferric-dicitrate binding protein FerR (iron transport regulator)
MAGRELDELFRTWRAESLPPSLPSGVDDRAGSAVVAAALRRVAEQKRQRSRVRRLGAAFALAAAVTGLGVGAWFELRPNVLLADAGSGVSVSGEEGDVALTDGSGSVLRAVSVLTEGYGVRTERGGATLGFPSGASAKVASKTSLKLTRAREKEALFLARGGVDVEVPKLDPTHGFSVETPDALVTVHGTRFSVVVEPTPDGPRTRVQVTRGVVSVQKDGREVFLTAGQGWPAPDVAPVSAPGPAAAAPAPASAAPSTEDDVSLGDDESDEAPPAGPVAQKKQGKSRKFDSRELADQNQRFARAMSAKKNGDSTTALRELAALLRRYPGSPLTQELRVERLRMLRTTGRRELAAHEARRYLREFPQGYAVAEAEELLAGQP